MEIFKMIARLTESYFYLCISLGFLTSLFLCASGVLMAWNVFVNSKNEFLKWLKIWECRNFILEKYSFALLSEQVFKEACECIEDKELRISLNSRWEALKPRKEDK